VVTLTRAFGGLLIVVGVVAYLATGMESATALLPAVLGIPILVLGLLAGRAGRERGLIVAAVVLAALGALGTAMNVADLPALLAGDDVERPAAVVTSAITAVLCLAYVIAGIRWLVTARAS
jgi:hypothetical protein